MNSVAKARTKKKRRLDLKRFFISFQDGKFAMSMVSETTAVAEGGAWRPEYSDASHMLLALEMGEFTGMTWRTFEVNDEDASAAREWLLERAEEMGDDFGFYTLSSIECSEEDGVPWEKADRFLPLVFGDCPGAEGSLAEALMQTRSRPSGRH